MTTIFNMTNLTLIFGRSDVKIPLEYRTPPKFNELFLDPLSSFTENFKSVATFSNYFGVKFQLSHNLLGRGN